ncbi:MAG TPA: TIGR02117 family protein [Vicinamibacterales bacterium]|nr:TIGR02117 family protein [Vicinamibacterales bacterium]
MRCLIGSCGVTVQARPPRTVFGVAVASVLVILGCSQQPPALRPPEKIEDARSVPAFVVSHGWHTGLVVPAAELNALISELAARFGTPAYYEIGWGDKGFYQAQDVTIGLALQAMLWSTGSIVHIVAVPESPYLSFPDSQTLTVCLASSQVEQMENFIASSIVRDDMGHVVSLGKGIYGDSQFYDGVGRYSLLNTCNKWTAKGLQSAGLAISPTFKLTAESIMDFLRQHSSPTACLK